MSINRLQSHHTATDTSRASGRDFVRFDVPLPRAGAKPPEIMRALLHQIGMTDADVARFSKQNGYDPVEHSLTAMQKYGGFHKASVHVTREHPQGVARLEIPRADYNSLRHFINGSATNAMPDSASRSARANGEAYAAQRGINTAAQVRARLDAKLPAGKTSAPQVASSSRANSVAQTKPVAQMTTTEKLQFAVERAAAHLGPEAAEKLRALVTPGNLAIMAGTTAALIAVQGVPVLDVLVDAGIAGVAVYSLGTEAIGVIKDLAGFASGVMNAKTESDLDRAGQQMARAVSTVGVDAVAALLLHKAGGAMKENMPRTPAMREMVTPEGIRIRVPVEEPPAQRSVSRMSSEGNGGGEKVAGPSGRTSTEKYLERRWDKATFSNVRKSIEYHVAKHGKGLSFVEYTQRAMKAFNDPKAVRTSTTDIQGRAAINVRSKQFGSGLFTPQGRLIWFHPAP